MKSRRTDYGRNTDEWFDSLDDSISSLGAQLRLLFHAAVPDITECIKWGTPVFEKGGQICSMRAGKGYVALQFGSIGTSLKDPEGLLEGTGKSMRHVKIRSKTDLKKQLFSSWIKQAVKANLGKGAA